MNRMSWREAVTRLGVAVAVMLGAAQALAAPVISIDITSAGGGYGYSNTQETTENPDGSFGLSGVAGGAAIGASFDCDWSIVVNPDPQITSTFTLTNISGVTQSFIMNVTLPIAAIAGRHGSGRLLRRRGERHRVHRPNNSNGVTLATVGANPFYSALVNGINLSQGLGSCDAHRHRPGTSGDTSQENWGTPIPSAPFGPASGEHPDPLAVQPDRWRQRDDQGLLPGRAGSGAGDGRARRPRPRGPRGGSPPRLERNALIQTAPPRSRAGALSLNKSQRPSGVPNRKPISFFIPASRFSLYG